MVKQKLIIFCFLPLIAFSQPVVQWRKAIKNGVQSINSAVAFSIDREGNTYIAGNTHEADSSVKMLLVKIDSAGTEKWRRVYHPDGYSHAIAIAMTLDISGNTLITGTVKNKSGNTDIVTLKFSPDGILYWENFYAGNSNLFDAPNAITTDKKGNVLVCGYETVSEANPDLLLIRYLSNGEKSFIRSYSTPEMDVALDLATDDSCNIYICGNSNVGTHIADIVVMKYDSSGTLHWNYLFDGEQHAVDLATDLAIDDSSNILVTGIANHANDRSDVPLLKINRFGVPVSSNIISRGIADGTGNRINVSEKNIFLQTTFSDYLQQTVSVAVFRGDKNCKEKKTYNAPTDVTYLEAIGWNANSFLLCGSILSRPENTIAPYIEMVDSLNNTAFVMHDDVLISLLRIKDVFLSGKDVYFLGDDATENAGTISVARYSFPESPKNKAKVYNPKKK